MFEIKFTNQFEMFRYRFRDDAQFGCLKSRFRKRHILSPGRFKLALIEGKAVKERFDDLFASVRYVKALE